MSSKSKHLDIHFTKNDLEYLIELDISKKGNVKTKITFGNEKVTDVRVYEMKIERKRVEL